MNLTHYSLRPITFDPSRTYEQTPFINGKPRGFWLSVDGPDDWAAWCEAEGFRTEHLTTRTPFELVGGHSVLIISTLAELRAFTEQYRGNPELPGEMGSVWLDWQAVAGRYDGVIVAPYQWQARLDFDTFWYYGWDCASGCIWNLGAISVALDNEGAKPSQSTQHTINGK